ncbi:iron ABC transporter permease [Corynebacterium pseudotuberculosis]|uniref:metal ABC transporter permease n=1 Tax=Corynebacterium pseudotuberculosis TaxID=1719 RepID=UPI000737B7CE|nr:metal ABC transporter permease [Corynebacterium pseudotuberculosis]ALU20732.1 iron ABC transporter permease [Corynebacterium pseudotuberculosis]ANH22902.1 Manganese/zinc/iron transport system [Corynebacterium pseudotuberculosis]
MSIIDFLAEFSYRRVVWGTLLIGLCSGAMGTFLYLRRQSMMSDVIGHSATPGVMGAFLFFATTPWLSESQLLADWGIDARSMPVITIGAMVTGLASAIVANAVADSTRIGIDSTMAVMLSLFLGGGLILLQVIQRSHIRGKGGIDELMFGNAATLTNLDVKTLLVVCIAILVLIVALWRPFTLVTFDPVLAQVSGMPRWVSHVLFLLVVVAIVIGVKAVGLILMIAFTVFPPAAARQWTRTVAQMVVVSGLIGAIAAIVGSYISISAGKVPTGPVIVLVLAAFVIVALVASPRRAAVIR